MFLGFGPKKQQARHVCKQDCEQLLLHLQTCLTGEGGFYITTCHMSAPEEVNIVFAAVRGSEDHLHLCFSAEKSCCGTIQGRGRAAFDSSTSRCDQEPKPSGSEPFPTPNIICPGWEQPGICQAAAIRIEVAPGSAGKCRPV